MTGRPWNYAKMKKLCNNCRKKFLVSPARKDLAKFCSMKCLHDSRKGIQSWNAGKKLTELHRKNLRAAKIKKPVRFWAGKERADMRGANNWNWRGGKYQDDRLKTKEWKRIREFVLWRDNHECQACGRSDKVHVHHRVPFRFEGSDREDNLTTLCQSCHTKIEFGDFPCPPHR